MRAVCGTPVSRSSIFPLWTGGTGPGNGSYCSAVDHSSAATAGLDPTVPHPARRYNYWLGGKDNFAADRASGDELEKLFPKVRAGALANRALLRRATRYLAAEAGIRQFLDIGTGLPTADNTHEVAQGVAPTSRVVY